MYLFLFLSPFLLSLEAPPLAWGPLPSLIPRFLRISDDRRLKRSIGDGASSPSSSRPFVELALGRRDCLTSQ